MKIHVSKLKDLAATWMDNKVMPRSNAMQKFVLTFALLQKGDTLVDMLKPLADAEGMIELDHLKEALQRAGGKIELPYINWVFDEDDLNYIMEVAKSL